MFIALSVVCSMSRHYYQCRDITMCKATNQIFEMPSAVKNKSSKCSLKITTVQYKKILLNYYCYKNDVITVSERQRPDVHNSVI